MSIKINFPITIKQCEGKFDLKLYRERLDYKNLLLELKSGKRLNDIFPQRQVAESIRTQLSSASLSFIDKNDKVLSEGEKFIANPYKFENEGGVYSIDYASINLNGRNRNIILRMNRKLDRNEKNLVSFDFNNFTYGNDIKMGENETIQISQIENMVSSRVFQGKEENGSISFDAVNGKYTSKFGEYKAGEPLSSDMKNEILSILKEKVSYLEVSGDLKYCYIDSLVDINNEDKKNGFISQIQADNVEITKMPFKLRNFNLAKEYAYWYLYEKINSGEYLSLNDMNDLYQNEILGKDIFDSKIFDSLFNVTITLSGFKDYLPDSLYQKLSYRLNVMKILLDFDANQKDYTKVSSYGELVDFFKQEIDYKNVKRVYMVMGYPYVANVRNKMIECINEFNKVFKDIIIVKKQPTNPNSQKEDMNIKNELKSNGIICYESTDIQNAYHDRFMVFDLGTSQKVFFVSCEIGQFFSDNNEARGYINPIELSITVRNGKNLLEYIKECK